VKLLEMFHCWPGLWVQYWLLSLAKPPLSYAPALEMKSLSVIVSDLTCVVAGRTTEKETAAKERSLKECLKKTWFQTDVRMQDDLNRSK
jgi:hypothetical protein